MYFTSLKYYGFLILALSCFFLKKEHRFYAILIFNYIFYALFSIYFVFILAFITAWSYCFSKILYKNKNKSLLFISIIPIVIALFGLKYCTFDNAILSELIAPVGLSFYSLEAIGYLVDNYKYDNRKVDNFLVYLCSLSYFPIIASGPIEKPYSLSNKLKNEIEFKKDNVSEGLFLIANGLFKKIVIANKITPFTATIFDNANNNNGISILIGIILYSIEIYCDFSGYSEIAIGSSKILGIDLTTNFKTPYFSTNIKDFWSRWHISLSSWLKEYIYIPLGGNRCSNTRIINILIVFVVSGLWHGAAINFVIWGLLHGITNIIFNKDLKSPLLSTILVFVIVSIEWVFFRANTLNDAISIFKNLFHNFSIDFASIEQAILLFTNDINSIPYALTLFIMVCILFIYEWKISHNKAINNGKHINAYLVIITVCIILFGSFGANSFIYMNF